MPEISRFFGIVIKMFFDDHNPPHFHAEYGGSLALIDIRTLAVFSGRLPVRVTGLVIEWATLHQQELLADWDRARAGRTSEDCTLGINTNLEILVESRFGIGRPATHTLAGIER
jgi:hypothetical protein